MSDGNWGGASAAIQRDPVYHTIQFGRGGTRFDYVWLHFLTSTLGFELRLEQLFARQ